MSLPLDATLAARFAFIAFDVAPPVNDQMCHFKVIIGDFYLQVTQPVRTLATIALVALGRLESANMDVVPRSGSLGLALSKRWLVVTQQP